MSQASLTQTTKESHPHFGSCQDSFGECFLPELGRGFWLRDSLGPLGLDDGAGRSEAESAQDKQQGFPTLSLDSVSIYHVAALRR